MSSKCQLPILNLASFSLFDQRDSDQPEKINILLLSGCCLWTLRDHKTLAIGDKNWDEFTMLFFFNSRGLSFWGLRSEVWVFRIWVFMTPTQLKRHYVQVKSKLKHLPRAYPGHLTSFAAQEERNLMNLVFPRATHLNRTEQTCLFGVLYKDSTSTTISK